MLLVDYYGQCFGRCFFDPFENMSVQSVNTESPFLQLWLHIADSTCWHGYKMLFASCPYVQCSGACLFHKRSVIVLDAVWCQCAMIKHCRFIPHAVIKLKIEDMGMKCDECGVDDREDRHLSVLTPAVMHRLFHCNCCRSLVHPTIICCKAKRWVSKRITALCGMLIC